MGYGLTNHLLALSGLVFVASAVLAARRLPFWGAVTVALIRVFLPMLYFAWYFDGQWTFLDDLTYAEHGEYLLEKGITPVDILTHEGREQLYALTGSWHILYSWWNLLTMWLFGAYYYVPVFVNVFVTFVSAHLLAKLLDEAGFTPSYRQLMYLFYLLHWDTIAWSSIANVKDALVQLMTIGLVLCILRLVRRRLWIDLGWCLGLVYLFQQIRFYVPFVLGASAAVCVFLQWKDVRKYPLLAGALLMGLWLVPGRGLQFLENYSPFELLYGMGRFALTPQPWNIGESYTFLMLPATLHWLLILPAGVGGAMLWRDSSAARLLLLYAFIMIVMYALADDFQGVRQRAQLSVVFAWAQMHFLWRWTHTPATSSVTTPAAPKMNRPRRFAIPQAT